MRALTSASPLRQLLLDRAVSGAFQEEALEARTRCCDLSNIVLKASNVLIQESHLNGQVSNGRHKWRPGRASDIEPRDDGHDLRGRLPIESTQLIHEAKRELKRGAGVPLGQSGGYLLGHPVTSLALGIPNRLTQMRIELGELVVDHARKAVRRMRARSFCLLSFKATLALNCASGFAGGPESHGSRNEGADCTDGGPVDPTSECSPPVGAGLEQVHA